MSSFLSGRASPLASLTSPPSSALTSISFAPPAIIGKAPPQGDDQENDSLASNSRPTTPFDDSGKGRLQLDRSDAAESLQLDRSGAAESLQLDSSDAAESLQLDGSDGDEEEAEQAVGAVAERRSRLGLQADGGNPPPPPESEDERMAREIQESENLARQLMAEEAMASYAVGAEFLRDNADQFSGEDLAALQAAMMEDQEDGEELEDQLEGEAGEGEGELSYETMLQLGERIGDVKTERWKMRAAVEIAKLPLTKFCQAALSAKTDANDSELKCLVCQCEYEEGEEVRTLPCGHVFHAECVDEWLSTRPGCAYCKKSIVEDDE